MSESSHDLLGQDYEDEAADPPSHVTRWLLIALAAIILAAAAIFYVVDIMPRDNPAQRAAAKTGCESLVREYRSVAALGKAYESRVSDTRWSDVALRFKRKYPLAHATWDPADLKAKAGLESAVTKARDAYNVAANGYNASAKSNHDCANRGALPKDARGQPPPHEVPLL